MKLAECNESILIVEQCWERIGDLVENSSIFRLDVDIIERQSNDVYFDVNVKLRDNLDNICDEMLTKINQSKKFQK